MIHKFITPCHSVWEALLKRRWEQREPCVGQVDRRKPCRIVHRQNTSFLAFCPSIKRFQPCPLETNCHPRFKQCSKQRMFLYVQVLTASRFHGLSYSQEFFNFPSQRTTAEIDDRFRISSCMSATFETRRLASQRSKNNSKFFVILNIFGRSLNDRGHLGVPVFYILFGNFFRSFRTNFFKGYLISLSEATYREIRHFKFTSLQIF